MKWNLDQHAVLPHAMTVQPSYSGQIGLPEYNANGYKEYRSTYLQLGIDNTVGLAYAGTGSRAKFDFASQQTTIVVNGTGISAEAGVEPLLIKGTGANSSLTVNKGTVGVAIFASETAALNPVTIGFLNSPTTDAAVRILGGSVSTLTMSGGTLDTGAITPLSGTTTIIGPATLTTQATLVTANNYAGTIRYNGTAIGTYKGGNGSTIDTSQSAAAKTFTTTTVAKGATINDPDATITFTNGIIYQNCKHNDVQLDIGFNRTVTPN